MHPPILRPARAASPALLALLAFGGACSDASSTAPDGRVAAVVLTPNVGTLLVGDTLRIPAVVRDRGGRPVGGVTLAWQSSNEQVATVTADGAVVAHAAGRATIRARAGAIADSAVVQVGEAAVASVELPDGPTLALVRYDERQLAAVVRDARGRALTGRAVAWTSADPTVVAVDGSGRLAAVKAGATTVVAASEGRSAAMVVVITAAPATRIALPASAIDIEVGELTPLAVALHDARDQPTQRPVTWTTSDSAIATVSVAGLVTALRLGTVELTATSDGPQRAHHAARRRGARLRSRVQPAPERRRSMGAAAPAPRHGHPARCGAPRHQRNERPARRVARRQPPRGRRTRVRPVDGRRATRAGPPRPHRHDAPAARDAGRARGVGTGLEPRRHPSRLHLRLGAERGTPHLPHRRGRPRPHELPRAGTTTEESPSWSPDGTRLAYAASDANGSAIWTMRADGTDRRRITTLGGQNTRPAWLPTGQVIAFEHFDAFAGDHAVRLVPAAGGATTLLTAVTTSSVASQPTWSPDGRFVAFVQVVDGAAELFTMRPDGSALRRRTFGGAGRDVAGPAWTAR
jgi:uncharacterized protein YjdB